LALQSQKSAICARFAPVLAIFYLRVWTAKTEMPLLEAGAAPLAVWKRGADEVRPRYLPVVKSVVSGACTPTLAYGARAGAILPPVWRRAGGDPGRSGDLLLL
jgi:hypothetical protein